MYPMYMGSDFATFDPMGIREHNNIHEQDTNMIVYKKKKTFG